MSFECQYCKKKYSSKWNLANHQKTTKYCIKIQKEINIEQNNIETVSYDCEYCKKSFTSKMRLNKHIESCLEKSNQLVKQKEDENVVLESQLSTAQDRIVQKEDENAVLESQLSIAQYRIIDLENQLKTVRLEIENELIKENNDKLKEKNDKLETTVEEIAKQPKNQQINNKIIITTHLDLSSQAVQQAIESNFSHEHLTMGQKGVARFAYDNMLKDEQGKLKYICTDPSRQVFQYKNDKGVVQKDVRATKLTKALLDADIKQTSHKIAWDKMEGAGDEAFMAYTNHYQNIQGMEKDNSEFSKELSCLTV
jgi:chromosome segregation ATPase